MCNFHDQEIAISLNTMRWARYIARMGVVIMHANFLSKASREETT
jgi:hypothetical protein